MKITLPFPPSVNSYYRSVDGRVIISAKGREYRKTVARQVGWGVKPMAGYLSVSVVLCPPDKRVRDIDNYCKGLFDALTKAGVWTDDSQIKRMQIEFSKVNSGCVIVEAQEIDYA